MKMLILSCHDSSAFYTVIIILKLLSSVLLKMSYRKPITIKPYELSAVIYNTQMRLLTGHHLEVLDLKQN